MRAFYCDRCGKLTKHRSDPTTRIEFDCFNEKVFDGDMCEKCQDALENFLENKK